MKSGATPQKFPAQVRRVFLHVLRGNRMRTGIFLALVSLFCGANSALAQATNTLAPATTANLPDPSASLLRVFGALALVLGLFLGGAWFFKNWRRLATQRGQQPKLNIHETRSLGARQAIFVVGYEKQRFLVATSPAGVSLLSHLPDAEAIIETESGEKNSAPMPFAQALAQLLKGK
jgi:flagellar biogenesis protein FliO